MTAGVRGGEEGRRKDENENTLIKLGGAAFICRINRDEGDAFIRQTLDHEANHVDVAPIRSSYMLFFNPFSG